MLDYMANRYNFFYFEAEFKKYLIAGKAGGSTVKNYLSDLHYFFSWMQSSLHISEIDYSDMQGVFSHSLIRSYYSFLISSTNSENTVLRRLATLRKFFALCVDQQWLTSNPTNEFDKKTKQDEQEEIILHYKKFLQDKHYTISDIDRRIAIISDLVTNSVSQ